MIRAWSCAGGPGQTLPDAVTVVEGATFCVSDASGDFDRLRPTGLFVRDTRVLDRWDLDVDGLRPEPLTVHHSSPHTVLLVGRVSVLDGDHEVDVLVQRERFVGEGMLENLQVRNATGRAVRVRLTLQVGADFAALAAVRQGRVPLAAPSKAAVGPEEIELSAPELTEHSVAVATGLGPAVDVSDSGFAWWVDLEPHGTWTTYVQVVPRLHGAPLQPHHVPGAPPEEAAPARRHREIRRSTPRLTTASRTLADVLATSLVDLGALRLFDPEHPRLPLVATGAPWAMGTFVATDSLLTSMMLLAADPHLALGTLTTLAVHQGTDSDDSSGEQPGRILDSLHFASTHGSPGTRVSYDHLETSALFVAAAGALHQWHPHLVSDELTRRVDLALEWIQGPGDPNGDGLLEPAEAPGRAPAVAQAYAYAAYCARSEMAEAHNDPLVAERWLLEAEQLKATFDERFWMPRLQWYAAEVGPDGEPAETIGSHVVPCLWSGIVDEAKAGPLVERLTSPELFSGWGLRTLSSAEAAYNPFGQHTGAVWPHETAMCVAGLARYGFMAEAGLVAEALLDTAAAMGNRLPELLTGVARAEVPVPVPHPSFCSPHAVASAAPVEVLRSLLRLAPTADGLACDPRLPAALLPLELHGVQCGGVTYDITVDEHGGAITARPRGTVSR